MRYLASKKLAIALIITLALLSLLGMTLPQTESGASAYRVWLGHYPAYVAQIIDFLQLNRVFTSWWLKSVFALFLLNLSACTLLQVLRALAPKTKRPVGPVYRELAVATGHGMSDKVADFFSTRGYIIGRTVDGQGQEIYTGRRYGFSRWSGVVLHIGLLVLLIGLLVSILTKTDGIIPVMEGQQTSEDQANYVALNRGIFADKHTDLPIILKNLVVAVDRKHKSWQLTTGEMSFGRDILHFDDRTPVQSNGFTVYHDRLGYTITVNLNGVNVPAGFTFPLTTDADSHSVYSNEFLIPGSNYTLTVRLYPNAVRNAGSAQPIYSSDGDALLNPLVYVSIMADKQPLGAAFLKKGEARDFAGVKLQIQKIGYWSSFRIVKDHSSPFIYAGFFFVVVGLALAYLFVPKEIWVEVSADGKVRIGGTAGHYRTLFHDELDELILLLEDRGIR